MNGGRAQIGSKNFKIQGLASRISGLGPRGLGSGVWGRQIQGRARVQGLQVWGPGSRGQGPGSRGVDRQRLAEGRPASRLGSAPALPSRSPAPACLTRVKRLRVGPGSKGCVFDRSQGESVSDPGQSRAFDPC
eukprot:952124-Rhodomonas_salina.2